MPIPAHLLNRGKRRCDWLRQVWLRGAWSCACLLAVLPPARAHGDDERPTPEVAWWSLLCFLLTLAYVLILCLRAPYKARSRFHPPRTPRLKSRPQARPANSLWKRRLHRTAVCFSRIVTADIRQPWERSRLSRPVRVKTPKT